MDTKISDEFPLKVAVPTASWASPSREEILEQTSDGLWQHVLAWLFLVTGFAYVLFNKYTPSATEITYVISMSQGIFMMAMSQALLIYLHRKQTNHVEIGRGFRRLRSRVPEDADLPVQIEVVRDGSLTGRDRGYVWQEDGTWYFKGLITAFRINQQDVVPVEAWPRAIKPSPSRDKAPTVFPIKYEFGTMLLKIKVLDPYEDYRKRKRVKAFYREMYDWLYERPRGVIETLLPPVEVHPSLYRSGLRRYGGFVTAICMIALDGAALASLPGGGFATNLGNYGLMAGIFVTGMIFASVRFAWLETRDAIVRSRLVKKTD